MVTYSDLFTFIIMLCAVIFYNYYHNEHNRSLVGVVWFVFY